MRKLLVLLIVVCLTFAFVATSANAVTSPTKRPTTIRQRTTKARCVKARRYVKKHCVAPKRKAVPAKVGAGPKPSPTVINVPEGPAPIVNVPQQAAPVVNFPPLNIPNGGVTVDDSSIYIVRENELLIIGKSDLCLKKRVMLNSLPSPSTSTSD